MVISPTADEVEALYAARERLETAAVARTPTPAQLDAIVDAFARMTEATRFKEVRQIVDMDLAFHSVGAAARQLPGTRSM